MRRSEGKTYGYVIVPAIVPQGLTLAEAQEASPENYKAIQTVLGALRSHDERTLDRLEDILIVREVTAGDGGDGNGPGDSGLGPEQGTLKLVSPKTGLIIAHIARQSGLKGTARGAVTANAILQHVQVEATRLKEGGAAKELQALFSASSEKEACTLAALTVLNATIAQKRMQETRAIKGLIPLEEITPAENPDEKLVVEWQRDIGKRLPPYFCSCHRNDQATQALAGTLRKVCEPECRVRPVSRGQRVRDGLRPRWSALSQGSRNSSKGRGLLHE